MVETLTPEETPIDNSAGDQVPPEGRANTGYNSPDDSDSHSSIHHLSPPPSPLRPIAGSSPSIPIDIDGADNSANEGNNGGDNTKSIAQSANNRPNTVSSSSSSSSSSPPPTPLPPSYSVAVSNRGRGGVRPVVRRMSTGGGGACGYPRNRRLGAVAHSHNAVASGLAFGSLPWSALGVFVGTWSPDDGRILALRHVVVGTTTNFDDGVIFRLLRYNAVGTLLQSSGVPDSCVVSWEDVSFHPPYQGLDVSQIAVVIREFNARMGI